MLDADKSIPKNAPMNPKCSTGAMEVTATSSALPMASAISWVGMASSATACRIVPIAACSSPSRTSRAASERCTADQAADPLPK